MGEVRIARRESPDVWGISYTSSNVNLITNYVKKMTEEGAVSGTYLYIAQRQCITKQGCHGDDRQLIVFRWNAFGCYPTADCLLRFP